MTIEVGDGRPETEDPVSTHGGGDRVAPNQQRAQPVRQETEATPPTPPRHRRYLSERMASATEYLRAAEQYVARKEGPEFDWLYRKPFDPSPGNKGFYDEWYSVMNLLGAMGLAPGDRVLEVGSGPGWVTEILVLLGYTVDALEPSEDMNVISRERIAASVAQHHVRPIEAVRYHATTLETCDIEPESFEALLFHAALHHVIDEEKGLARSFELLRPGGVIGISEWAWSPDNVALEAHLDEEMRVYGTLESPFTQEYLDLLLSRTGFVDIQRYHGVNGFFPSGAGQRPLAELASSPAAATNNLTARKPGTRFQVGRPVEAAADCQILESIFVERPRRLVLTARLENTSPLTWYREPRGAGYVTASLVGRRGTGPRVEARDRNLLPVALPPGAAASVRLGYELPEDYAQYEWAIELVSEHRYWFSDNGVSPCPVRLPAPVDYAASLEVAGVNRGPDGVEIRLAVTNRGTEWPRFPDGLGAVGAVLVNPAAEALQPRFRYELPELPAPGATVTYAARFDLPADVDITDWSLDLVADGVTDSSSIGLSRTRLLPAPE